MSMTRRKLMRKALKFGSRLSAIVSMSMILLCRIACFLARSIGIWCITSDMPPYKVVDAAIKKWHTPSAALAHLLRTKSLSVNVLYAACILWSRIEPGEALSDLQTLRTLLEYLPSEKRADAVGLATNHSLSRVAYILTSLSPPVSPGL